MLSPQEYKRVLLTGQLTITFVAALVAFTIMDLFWGYRYPIPFNLVGIAGGLIVYFVNRSGYFLTARVLLATIANAITLYFTAVLDRTMGLYQFAICINVGILAAFGYENYRISILLIAASTLLYLAALFHPFPRIERVDLADPIYLERNLLFGFLIATAASALVVFYLLQINHQSEARLVEKERSISVKNNELTQVNSELDRFFYSVSHDLRAPLASMQGLLSLLERAHHIEEGKEYLTMLKDRVNNLDHFVRTIASYASNARQEVLSQPVRLRILFREILENVRFHPQAESIKFHLDIPPHLECRSDPTRLQIIFGNLVSNAIKYSDSARAERWIKIGADLSAEQVQVSIRDNGMGIREDILPRIFDMFYRGHEQSQGSGLGLYIVKEAVSKLGGQITVNSVYGKGSEFTVSLPVAAHLTRDKPELSPPINLPS